jgi:uncharacterized protein (DUF983 family)
MTTETPPSDGDLSRATPSPRTLVARAIARRCPICGDTRIWKDWFSLRDACPNCGYVFIRESGYFLGALALNLIVAELLTMIVLTWLLIGTAWEWWEIELLVLPMAVILPLIFFPYARGLWMALDLAVHPPNQR